MGSAPKHPRRRRLIQLLSGSVCLLSLVLFVASIRWTVFVMSQFGDAFIPIKCGEISINWVSQLERARIAALTGYPLALEWALVKSRRVPPMQWWPPASYRSNGPRYSITIKLWPITLVAGAICAWTSRRQPFPPPLCPRCGYDMSGNSPARCPECGHA